ncbi:MAG: glycosyltransferase [Terriglobales bacterium]
MIVIALGSAGDVHPNVGLAQALRRRGHDVLFVGPSVFRALSERAALDFVGIGDEESYQEAIRDPDLWHPTRSFTVVAKRLILPALRPIYEIIANRRRPDTVIASSPLALAGRMAQEKLGLPLATVHLQPIMLRSIVQPACFGFPDILAALPRWLRGPYYRFADWAFVDRVLLEETNQFRRELGLPPVTRLFNGWVHSPERVIGLFPDWFAPPAPDWPPQVKLTGFPLWDESNVRQPSAELEEFLRGGDPPLVFTAGSANFQAKRFFEVSVAVCRAMRCRGLLLSQFPEQLPAPLPKDVRHFHYIPFSQVLPRSAALVHHGGIGTTSQAIAAGIPQLVVPSSHDQPDNAVRVRRLGIGDFLLPKNYEPKRVRKTIDRLMQPAVKDECRRRAAQLAGSKPLDTAAELIEQLGQARATSQVAAGRR